MKRKGTKCILGIVVLALISTIAFGAWKYSPSDLSDAGCIQNLLDMFLSTDGTLTATVCKAETFRDKTVNSTVTATNGYPLTVSGTIIRCNSSGGADLATNTITIANTTAGNMFVLVNTGTSNHLAVAKTGNWMSPALDLGEGEAAVVVAAATNELYAVEK